MERNWKKYLIFTFLLTYICHGALAILNHQGIIQLLSFWGQILFILGGSSPTIMAFVVVHLFYTGDDKKAFYRSLVNFKQSVFYYVFALLTPIVLGMIFLLIAYLFGNPSFDRLGSPLQFFVFFFPAIIFGGLEEVGWRGILQERLSNRFSPLLLAVIIGLIWGAWHLPMLFIPDLGYSNDVFLPFILQGLVFSLFLTWLYARTTSIPLVVVCHAAINAAGSIGLIMPFMNRLDVYIYILVGFAMGASLLRRHKRKSWE